MTLHVLDDPGALSERARRFLASQTVSPVSLTRGIAWYVCTDVDDREVRGPDGGLARLQEFFARFGGLTFGTERPPAGGLYQLDQLVPSGWMQTESGDWIAEVGEHEGWPLALSWSTGNIGIDLQNPIWIADSAENLIESAALGQGIYGSPSWREAVLVTGKEPGQGLDIEVERFHSVVPQDRLASSQWNRWLVDDHVAVHAWHDAHNEKRRQVVMAWYRSPEGRHRIEAVAGPLRPD